MPPQPDQRWTVKRAGRNKSRVEGSYDGIQYVALETKDSYLRLVHGPDCGWGTSIVTMPIYWTGGKLHHGTKIDAEWKTKEDQLILTAKAIRSPLDIITTITVQAPVDHSIRARVESTLTGKIELDSRPGEAFKPLFLSSMHISDSKWDASKAYNGKKQIDFPKGPWLIPTDPISRAKQFGLIGGSSDWKKNAPTVAISLDKRLQIAGWISPSDNPNGDNIGLWAASNKLLPTWSYEILVTAKTSS